MPQKGNAEDEVAQRSAKGRAREEKSVLRKGLGKDGGERRCLVQEKLTLFRRSAFSRDHAARSECTQRNVERGSENVVGTGQAQSSVPEQHEAVQAA